MKLLLSLGRVKVHLQNRCLDIFLRLQSVSLVTRQEYIQYVTKFYGRAKKRIFTLDHFTRGPSTECFSEH